MSGVQELSLVVQNTKQQHTMIIYKTFVNGIYVIKNVPYQRVKEKGKQSFEILSAETMARLAEIQKFMQLNSVFEFDYQYFLAIRNNPVDYLEEKEIWDEKQIKQYVLKEWLDKYHEYNRILKFEKSEAVKEKLSLFQKKFRTLEPIHQEIIEKKYLLSEEVKDETVFHEMRISRSLFYREKSKALLKLGTALLKEEVLCH